jgi:hypothetical protein
VLIRGFFFAPIAAPRALFALPANSVDLLAGLPASGRAFPAMAPDRLPTGVDFLAPAVAEADFFRPTAVGRAGLTFRGFALADMATNQDN